MDSHKFAVLVLGDGKVYKGLSCGAHGESVGEVVFNTSMSGYQEILTDPSYTGQMVTFTYPHIGNVGVNENDIESDKPHVSGLIVREMCDKPSNYRATDSLPNYLRKNNIVAISGIDTRALVLHLRTNGSQMGIIKTSEINFSDIEIKELIQKAKIIPSIEGQDLVPNVSTENIYQWREGPWSFSEKKGDSFSQFNDSELKNRPHLVAIDFGIKKNILRLLTGEGFRVTVVPAKTSPEKIKELKPQALFLSNGPGDPAAVTYGIETTKALLGIVPTFGICLGHQILGIAVGAPTFKLKFGHRGGNHPVKNIKTGQVEISVQNHGFATKKDSIPDSVTVTHINLNDDTIEGIEVPDLNAFSVQYHPECSPGPHDSSYLFKDFYTKVEKFWK
jgi:carbamoyl-phosphate synthase small subunit